MDENELNIIRELREDSQKSFNKIAKKLAISPETVRKKYGKMKKEGTIIRCSIAIDLSKFGYESQAFLMIKNRANHKRSTTKDYLKKIKNVFLIGEVTGNFDLFAVVAIKNMKSFAELLAEVKNLPTVERVETSLVDDCIVKI